MFSSTPPQAWNYFFRTGFCGPRATLPFRLRFFEGVGAAARDSLFWRVFVFLLDHRCPIWVSLCAHISFFPSSKL